MKKLSLLSSLVLTMAVSTSFASQPAQAGDYYYGSSYEITITNLTRGQILSPVSAYAHDRRADALYQLGEPASDALAALAEDADNQPLIDAVDDDPLAGELHVITGVGTGGAGPIVPGETVRYVIDDVERRHRRLTLAGMLVTTNDAFVALNGVKLPRNGGTSTVFANVYDAGSEANTESCEHIPGPPCGSAGVRVTEGAEGYVHVHAGIHGVADLSSAEYDWRNPGVRISIRHIRR